MKYWLIGVGIVLGLAFTIWLLSWILVPAQVYSVQNVQQQWAFAYQYDKSLAAQAKQICATEAAITQATDPNEVTQRRTQVLAMEQNYERIESQYDAALANAFQAKLVKPPDVPNQAPTLGDEKKAVCAQ